MANLTKTVAQFLVDPPYTDADIVTVRDSATNIQALTPTEIAELSTKNVDFLDSTSNIIRFTVAQLNALAITVVSGDSIVLADTSTNLAAQDATFFSGLSAKKVTAINPSDGVLVLTVAQYSALGGVAIDASATATLADSGAALAALTTAQLSALAGKAIDRIDATDNALSLTVAKFNALGTVALTAADVVTIADTGANLAAMSTSQLNSLTGKNVDVIDATDNSISLTVAKYKSLNSVVLGNDDTGTLADTGAAIGTLTTIEIAALATKGFDTIDATSALSLTVAQYQALGTVTLTGSDTVTLADSGANIAALTASQIGDLAADGIDAIDATDGSLSLTVAQYQALGAVTLTVADTVTLADTGTNIAALSAEEIGELAGKRIDRIDASDNTLALTVAQFSALGTVQLNSGDSVTLVDTGAALGGMSATLIGTLGTKGVDALDADDDTLSLTVAQYRALGTVGLTAGDVVTLSDTGANLASLTVSEVSGLAGKGVDAINATDDTLSLTVAQYTALGTVTLDSGDTVTLDDTGTNIAALSAAAISDLAADGIDVIFADGVLALTVAQFNALGTVVLTADDDVALRDTSTNLQALLPLELQALEGKFIDEIDATDNVLSLSAAQVLALGAVTISSTDVATLTDTQSNIEALTEEELENISDIGVDFIDSTSGELTLTVEQAKALNGVKLVDSDLVTLSDTGENISSMSAGEIAELDLANFDVIDASDGSFILNVSQYLALGGVTLTSTDFIILSDLGSAFAALTPTQIASLSANGIDQIDATDNTLSLTVAQFNSLGTLSPLADDNVEIKDTAANLGALSDDALSSLAGKNVDSINATGGTLTMTVQRFLALGTVVFAATNTVTIADSAANFAALTPSQIASFATHNVDALDVTSGALTLTLDQALALGGLSFSAADVVTVAGTAADIEALTAEEIEDLAASNIDFIDATDADFNLTKAQALALGAMKIGPTHDAFLNDTGAEIALLTPAQIAGLGTSGLSGIDASDGLLSLTVAQYNALGSLSLSAGDTVTLSDTGAAIAALSSGTFAGLATKGIDTIDASDNTLALTVAQFNALGSVTLTAGDSVTIRDTGANLATLDFASLAGKNVDSLDASDNVLTLTVAKYQALGAVTLTSGDVVTLADAGGTISGLDATAIGNLAGNGIDRIDATDNILSLTAAQAIALGAVTIVAGDVVTLSDTGDNIAALSAIEIGGLAGKGVDVINATDDVLELTVSQYLALGGLGLTASDTVTLLDTGANLAALTSVQIAGLAAKGVDKLDATDDLFLTVAQFNSLGTVSLTLNNDITLRDSGANLAAMTAAVIGTLAGKGIDAIDATDNSLFLTVAQYRALGTVDLTEGDLVTIRDTGTALAGLTAVEIGNLDSNGVDVIDSTTNVLALSVAQYLALGDVLLTGADVVTLLDTGTNIAALSASAFEDLADDGIDIIDASDGNLSLTADQFLALGTVSLTASDIVVLADSGSSIEDLTPTEIASLATKGVDRIDASNNDLELTVAQYLALGTVALTSSDSIKIEDSGSNIASLTAAQIAGLAAKGIDEIETTNGSLSLTVAQYNALGTVSLDSDDTVTIADTGAALAAMSAATISGLAAKNVDRIDATDNALALTVAQYNALGSVQLASGDTVTLRDTAANIAGMSVSAIGNLGANGIDFIDSTNNTLSLTAAKAAALGTVAIVAADVATVLDTGTALAALNSGQIAALATSNIDVIDSSTNALSLSLAQYNALGAIRLTLADSVTIVDTASNISALSPSVIAAMAGKGIDTIDVSDTNLSLSAAQVLALGTVKLASSDVITLADTASALQALTAAQIAALAAKGIDVIDASDNVLSLTVAQYNALGTVTLAAGDVVTLTDTATALQALTAAQIAGLAAKGVDAIDSTTNVLALTVAQYLALGTVDLTSADVVTLRDTAAALAALTPTQVADLGANGVDFIDSTNNTLSLSVEQYQALGSVGLTSTDVVTLVDVGGDIAGLAAAQIAVLAANGVDRIDATDNAITLNADQAAALGAAVIAATDVVTVSDTGANISNLTSVQLGGLASSGVDRINATDNTATLTVAQANALGTVTFDATDTAVTVSDTGSAISALTTTQLSAWVTRGVDSIDTTNNSLTLTAAQKTALGAITINTGDTLTVNGTGSNETINGHAGVDVLNGSGGNDTLNGLAGSDTINGGIGRDTMSGGADADVFVFSTISDAASGDTITDFTHLSDQIDLSAIDAIAATVGDDDFILDAIGTSTTAVATGHIGWYYDAANGVTVVRINNDADATIESTIRLTGNISLTSDDFIL